MKQSDEKKKEGRRLQLLFWCLVVPIMFAVFMRLFYVLFVYIYTPVVSFVIGSQYDTPLFIVSAITALLFTIGTIGWTYKQFKTHIMNG